MVLGVVKMHEIKKLRSEALAMFLVILYEEQKKDKEHFKGLIKKDYFSWWCHFFYSMHYTPQPSSSG